MNLKNKKFFMGKTKNGMKCNKYTVYRNKKVIIVQ